MRTANNYSTVAWGVTDALRYEKDTQKHASEEGRAVSRFHDSDRPTTSSSPARHKNAYNPVSSALADAFGIDE